MPPKPGGKPKKKKVPSAADVAMQRQQDAENTFAEIDADGSGSVDQKELASMLDHMLRKEGLEIKTKIIEGFVDTEFLAADKDSDGVVSFEEFVEYYNSFMDRMANGEVNQLIRRETIKLQEADAAAAAVQQKQDDKELYKLFKQLYDVLSDETVKAYCGLELNFDLETSLPDTEMCSSKGLAFDLSKGKQVLITPWGTFPISYRLCFPGFNEKLASIPASKEVFFELSTNPSQFPLSVMKVRLMPKRCYFQVTELFEAPQPKVEILFSPTPDQKAKMPDRWKLCFKEYVREQPLWAEKTVLVNHLLGRCVSVPQEKVDMLIKKLSGSRTKPTQEEMEFVLKRVDGDVEAAIKTRTDLIRSEDALVKRRGGHSGRAEVVECLKICDFDETHAMYLLENNTAVQRQAESIFAQIGLQNGLGYPTLDEIKCKLAQNKNNAGTVVAELKREWRMCVSMMKTILMANEVDQMCEVSAAKYGNPTRAHIQEFYEEKFDCDMKRTDEYMTKTGNLLKKARLLGNPDRPKVEALLFELNQEEARVEAFLRSHVTMVEAAAKMGKPTADDVERYLRQFDYNEERATQYMKQIHTFHNPKAPPKPKNDKQPVKRHIAAECGFPTRQQVELALTFCDYKDEDAIHFLIRIKESWEAEWRPSVLCKEDVEYALMAERKLIRDYEDYKSAKSGAQEIMEKMGELLDQGKEWGSPSKDDVKEALELFNFDLDKARARLRCVGSLMLKQKELLVESREEVEAAVELCEYDYDRSLKFLQGTCEVKKKMKKLGGSGLPAEEISFIMIKTDFDVSKALTFAEGFYKIWSNEETHVNLGSPTREQLGDAFIRFDFVYDKVLDYLSTVQRVLVAGEDLGNAQYDLKPPTREQVVEALDKCSLKEREALRSLKEEWRKITDKELREQYRQNLENQRKAKAGS